ncbi:pentatricopeptide repeat-containing protein [Quercus suber]|uniref:Pentatricopeptide repeat-containing protein n=1 Tax=Quercus suber TaxID=58331 RepID=A0AAW0MBF3_QUESU
MQMGDVCPNYVTLVSVLPAISCFGALELGKWVHLYAEKNGIEIDDVLGSALVDMYSKCGSIEKALQVFERLPRKNAITWSTIIGGLAMHGRANDALDYFSRMERSGVTPSDVTYIGVLSACSHAGLVDEGRSFFSHMVKAVGFEPRIEHYGCMVDLLGRAGHLEEAEELILNLPIRPDDVIWKALLGACKIHGNIEMGRRVAKVLMDMVPHDSGSYVALSNMYASSGNWEAVADVRSMMKEMDIRKDPGCSWIELDGEIHEFLVDDDSHSRAKEIHSMLDEIANQLRLIGYRPDTSQVLLHLDEEEKESALQYHSEKIAVAFGLICTSPHTPLWIVKNLRICEDCHSSMKLISKIYKRKIIIRDRKRFHHFEHGVLPAISCFGALELGKWVHLYAEKNGIEIDDVLGSALVDMYSKCGSIEKALQVFERLPRKNAITWSTIIGGLAMHGRANDALDYFSRMERSGVTPSDVTYIGVLSACSHAGLVDEGRSFFSHMVKAVGFEPRIEHYGCMVDLLGRAGHLEEAEELILNLPIRPDDVIWKALLGACKIHGNIEMGRRVAKVLMDMVPHDSGSYVALSNMYASSGNWEAVADVRSMMKEMDIRKDPGCSWIELDGEIHEFLVDDDSHSRAKEIHSMLDEIANQLRLIGYRPDTSQVLLHLDEEEKESALQYHSEKIAVAFGLICTSPHTPLWIVKNLRICEDCHSSMKLISKIYKRKIIIRDRKRFHHFEHGSCSCKDYW